MTLHRMLLTRAEEGRPLRVGLIGAGKFGSMFLAQALHTPGLHVLGVADLSVATARAALGTTGWPKERVGASSFAKALAQGTTHVTEDAEALISAGGIEVVVEATGVPESGIRHTLSAIGRGRHVVMVNVEGDVLAGPLLARRAAEAGVVYTLAYGDQPALICEQVDWARACGFEVVCAGKGTKYLPAYHASTPDTVWELYGLSPGHAKAGALNPKMFNSFLDGTKSAIEMAAVANATGLTPAPDGLAFPPAGADELAQVCRPRDDGGALHHKGTVEVVSSVKRNGKPVPRDLRWGVYVTFEAPSDYVARCFSEYGLVTDDTGRYTALYRPYHLIGLELGISVARAGLLGQTMGAAQGFVGDVVATAKRRLEAGEMLDGEGGFCVYGKLMPAADSLDCGGLPIGLAHGVRLKTPIAAGQCLRWSDVDLDEAGDAVLFRRQMEQAFAPGRGRPQRDAVKA